MMRLIPGRTRVSVELFKGVSLVDMAIAGVFTGLIVLVSLSTIPGKLIIAGVIGFIMLLLLYRMDGEPDYVFIMHILRHMSAEKRFVRSSEDSQFVKKDGESTEDAPKQEEKPKAETKAERAARLKAEAEERKRDDKILASKTASKAEQDAIWLKRANQSAARAAARKAAKQTNAKTNDIKDIMPYTAIKDGYIEFGGSYYGLVLEIPPVEFRFFSKHRRMTSIENGVGRVLRSVPMEFSVNIVKLERPYLYDGQLAVEHAKLEEVKQAYKNGVVSELELQSRVEVIYDRIKDLEDLCFHRRVTGAFYYIVLFDSDKKQLKNAATQALETLKNGELNAKLLDDKGNALFLKYMNSVDFDERDIENIAPENYYEWSLPKSVEIKAKTVEVNGIVTYNQRVINYPAMVGDAWLAGVMSVPSTKVVVKCRPADRGKATMGIDRSLQELRSQLNATGIDSKRIELQTHIDTLSMLLSTLQGDNEILMDTSIYVTGYDIYQTNALRAKDKKLTSMRTSITNMRKVLKRTYNEASLKLSSMEFDQQAAFIGSQVSSYDPMIATSRGIPGNTVGAMYPWIYACVCDKKGIHLGSSDGVPVFIDFFRRDSERVNSNMVIVGKSGSGKSYATKSLLTNLAADDSKIFILDPENEYLDLAANLHGKYINVGNAKFGRLNPFHVITSLDDDDAQADESGKRAESGSYPTHLQFLEEFFKQILPDCEKDAMEYLNSMIDRVYTNKGITAETDFSAMKPTDYPIFDDLYDTILREFQSTDNDYIRRMLRTLMNYVSKFSSGGRNANIWNGPSTVTTEENFTVFNFQSLLSNRNGAIANAQMLLVLKYIDNEIIKNREYNIKYHAHRKVIVVIDEAHVFIDAKYPTALDFMFQMAKRIRKYNGMQLVITQNIKDFVGSEELARKSTAIINACQYSFIFALAPNDMDDLCKLYEKAGGINENEQEQIVSAPRGQAFTVMSSQSRSTFKVEVPKNVVSMFHDKTFKSQYFTGEEGIARWEDFVGGMRAEHDENYHGIHSVSQNTVETVRVSSVHLEEITADEAEEFLTRTAETKKGKLTPTTPDKKTVAFEEISEGEAERLLSTPAKAPVTPTPTFTLDEDDDFDIPEIPDDPAEFVRMKAEQEQQQAEAERIAKEKAEAERIAKEKAEAERIARETAQSAQPTVTETATANVTPTAPSTPTATPQTAPQSATPSSAEVLLAELLEKMSTDAIRDQVQKTVLEVMMAQGILPNAQGGTSGVNAYGGNPSPTTTTATATEQNAAEDTSLGSIFNPEALEEAMLLRAEEEGATEPVPVLPEDAEDDSANGGGFDIMSLLAAQNDMAEEESVLENFEGDSIAISLEDLMRYNSQHG